MRQAITRMLQDVTPETIVSGPKFLSLRQRLMLTQQEMAEKTGLSLATIRVLEKKPQTKMQVKKFRAMANGLGRDALQLLREIGESDNGQEHGKPKADDFDHLSADELLALSEELKKQAAKKRGDGDGRKRKGA